MRDSSGELHRILESSDPIAIVVYSDPVERDHLLELMELLAPQGRTVLRTARVENALRPEQFNEIGCSSARIKATTPNQAPTGRAKEAQGNALGARPGCVGPDVNKP